MRAIQKPTTWAVLVWCATFAINLMLPISVHAQDSSTYAVAIRDGRGAFEHDDFARAEASFRVALSSAATPGQQAMVHGLLALTLEKRGEIDAARNEAQFALAINTNESRAREVLSRIGGLAPNTKSNTKSATQEAGTAVSPGPAVQQQSGQQKPVKTERVTPAGAPASDAQSVPASSWHWLSADGSEKIEVQGKDGKLRPQWVPRRCKVFLPDDLLRDLPASYPRRISDYALSIMGGRCKGEFVHGYKEDEYNPIAIVSDHPAPGHSSTRNKEWTVEIHATIVEGRIGEKVSVHISEGAGPGTFINSYLVRNGRVVDEREIDAANAGQKLAVLEDPSGRIDIASMRSSGTILGIKLGAPWPTPESKNLFKQTTVHYDKPCGLPARYVGGLLGGHPADISTYEGRVTKVVLAVPTKVHSLTKWLAVATSRFGKPDAIYEPMAFDKYAFYGTQEDDIKVHRVAPVTVFGRGTFYQIRFNDVALEKTLSAAIQSCADKAGGAILGAGIEAAGKALAKASKDAEKPGSFSCTSKCSGRFGAEKSGMVEPLLVDAASLHDATEKARPIFVERCRAFAFDKDGGTARPDLIRCERR